MSRSLIRDEKPLQDTKVHTSRPTWLPYISHPTQDIFPLPYLDLGYLPYYHTHTHTHTSAILRQQAIILNFMRPSRPFAYVSHNRHSPSTDGGIFSGARSSDAAFLTPKGKWSKKNCSSTHPSRARWSNISQDKNSIEWWFLCLTYFLRWSIFRYQGLFHGIQWNWNTFSDNNNRCC